MIKQVTLDDFIQNFETIRPDNFSRMGLRALFNFLNSSEYELNVIAVCCDWAEYKSKENALNDYGFDTISSLRDNTDVIDVDGGGVIVRGF